MSGYEFWDELGKIFSAVVAYQEKNVEFNKRFISPWIRLGNVFEKQDRNADAVEAYEKAIDLDPDNAQNWFELGNLQFKMQKSGEAIDAFNRALELDPGFGPGYSNLGLALATSGELKQAIPLYNKAIELLQEPADKAVAWNRLGNAYRKLNQYGQALDAFHKADELDQENAGFRDSMDEESEGPTLMQTGADSTAEPARPINIRPIELIVAENRINESKAEATAGEQAETLSEGATPIDPLGPPLEEVVDPEPAGMPVPSVVDTSHMQAPPEADNATVAASMRRTLKPAHETDGEESTEVVTSESDDRQPVIFEGTDPLDNPSADEMVFGLRGAGLEDDLEPDSQPAAQGAHSQEDAPAPSLADTFSGETPGEGGAPRQVAYEEYLKDVNHSEDAVDVESPEEAEQPGSVEPVPTIGPSGEMQIAMDTKNAHVWNELGNVYFNTRAYDDAIVAYSKAIELDRQLAWPYSNLALAYVQKRRFVEAILLYQRSIELFTDDKDKAISWNRLGNVYRRLNDYENAIAAYQRADALDPDNSTLSLQSRFSLLGNFAAEQKPSYVL